MRESCCEVGARPHALDFYHLGRPDRATAPKPPAASRSAARTSAGASQSRQSSGSVLARPGDARLAGAVTLKRHDAD